MEKRLVDKTPRGNILQDGDFEPKLKMMQLDPQKLMKKNKKQMCFKNFHLKYALTKSVNSYSFYNLVHRP